MGNKKRPQVEPAALLKQKAKQEQQTQIQVSRYKQEVQAEI
jgi:hypothetical protein